MAIEVEGKKLETDEEGFLLDPSEWNREVARAIAQLEKLELTDDRWFVVNFVRTHFDERQTVPEARVVLKAIGEERGTLEDVVEPYLLQQGFLMRTPRGRMATRHAYAHLGLELPQNLSTIQQELGM